MLLDKLQYVTVPLNSVVPIRTEPISLDGVFQHGARHILTSREWPLYFHVVRESLVKSNCWCLCRIYCKPQSELQGLLKPAAALSLLGALRLLTQRIFFFSSWNEGWPVDPMIEGLVSALAENVRDSQPAAGKLAGRGWITNSHSEEVHSQCFDSESKHP